MWLYFISGIFINIPTYIYTKETKLCLHKCFMHMSIVTDLFSWRRSTDLRGGCSQRHLLPISNSADEECLQFGLPAAAVAVASASSGGNMSEAAPRPWASSHDDGKEKWQEETEKRKQPRPTKGERGVSDWKKRKPSLSLHWQRASWKLRKHLALIFATISESMLIVFFSLFLIKSRQKLIRFSFCLSAPFKISFNPFSQNS